MRYMLLIYASEADYSDMTSEEQRCQHAGAWHVCSRDVAARHSDGRSAFAANEYGQDYSSS